jgi:hypothetical protein
LRFGLNHGGDTQQQHGSKNTDTHFPSGFHFSPPVKQLLKNPASCLACAAKSGKSPLIMDPGQNETTHLDYRFQGKNYNASPPVRVNFKDVFNKGLPAGKDYPCPYRRFF